MNTVKRDSFPYDEVEKRIGYSFKNRDLLVQAFTRSSYGSVEDNEVLEFIGDSVIGMLVTKILAQRYKRKPLPEEYFTILGYEETKYFECALDESELSKLKIELVQRSSLASATEKLELEQYLVMGKSDVIGEVQNQKSVKEDLFEAIIGAIAMDSNWDMALLENMVDKLLDIDGRFENGFEGEPDYVDILSRWLKKRGGELKFESRGAYCEMLPYEVAVRIDMMFQIFTGSGKTEKEAQRMAAKSAVEFIEMIEKRTAIIVEAVGKPDKDRAVNQLQELYQKKIIPEPKYTFVKYGTSKNGNPMWECSYNIEGVKESNGGYVAETKTEGKKRAAYDALNYLFGIDMERMFIEQGEITKITERNEEE